MGKQKVYGGSGEALSPATIMSQVFNDDGTKDLNQVINDIVVTPAETEAVTNALFAGKTYCCFGTSITAGGMNDSVPYGRWVGGHFNMKVVNFGASGTFSYQSSNPLSGNIKTSLLAQMPSDTMLVSIMNGANGGYWYTADIDSEDVTNCVGALNVAIAYIKENYPNAIIVIGPDVPTVTAMGTDGTTTTDSHKHIEDMKAIAAKHNVLYASAENVSKNTALRPDALHPNRQGYLMIAQSIIHAAETSIMKALQNVTDANYTKIDWL